MSLTDPDGKKTDLNRFLKQSEGDVAATEQSSVSSPGSAEDAEALDTERLLAERARVIMEWPTPKMCTCSPSASGKFNYISMPRKRRK